MIVPAAVEFKYRGREISQEDILVYTHTDQAVPEGKPPHVIGELCEAWQWRQDNGALRDLVCRGMLLMLDRAGQIALPPVSYVRHNPLSNRVRPEPARIDTTSIETGCAISSRWSSSRFGAPPRSRV